MTQLRHCKCGISNYFDRIYDGIGHRGSSFSDIDAVSHDGKTRRWLLQEFKQETEPVDPAQHWMLRDLAALPKYFTVWLVVKRSDGLIGFAEYGDQLRTITVDELRGRFRAWWDNVSFSPVPVVPPDDTLDPEPVIEMAAPPVASTPLEVPPFDLRTQREVSASKMLDAILISNLQFARDDDSVADRQQWIEVLELELRRRKSPVGVR